LPLAPPPCSFADCICRTPTSPLFPYTTLFRSLRAATLRAGRFWPPGSSPILSVHLGTACDRLLPDRPKAVGAAPIQSRDRLPTRSEEHTSELQSLTNLVCPLLLQKKNDYA